MEDLVPLYPEMNRILDLKCTENENVRTKPTEILSLVRPESHLENAYGELEHVTCNVNATKMNESPGYHLVQSGASRNASSLLTHFPGFF